MEGWRLVPLSHSIKSRIGFDAEQSEPDVKLGLHHLLIKFRTMLAGHTVCGKASNLVAVMNPKIDEGGVIGFMSTERCALSRERKQESDSWTR